jgi:hypothetical protein
VIFQHGRRLQPMSQIIDDGLQFVKHRRLPSLPVIWTGVGLREAAVRPAATEPA